MSGKFINLEIVSKVLLVASITFSFFGCVQTQPAPPTATKIEAAKASADVGNKGTSAEEKILMDTQAQTELQNTDCTKCHDSQPADIERNGGKHKTEIACLDCHLEHLPLGTKTIPQCAMCHDSGTQEHFKLPNCLGCHRNPHTPLDVTVDDVPPVTVACKTCHADKGEEFKNFPSIHATKNCTFCHPTKHKQIKKCLECHQPHADFLTYEDCLSCHKPHSPMNIQYADDIKSKYCGACHTEITEMLSKSKAKHGTFNCAFCHKTKHPTVPNCSDCHEQPHDNGMLTSFNSDCLKCHRNPHDLVF